MAGIFLSYTSSDRDWAFWIAKELMALGHTPHVHEWEVKSSSTPGSWAGFKRAIRRLVELGLKVKR